MENLSLENTQPEWPWTPAIYAVGDKLKVRLPTTDEPVVVEIDHIYEHYTAAVFRVKVSGETPAELRGLSGKFIILKLYDRRYALENWLRSDTVKPSALTDYFRKMATEYSGKQYEMDIFSDPPSSYEDPGAQFSQETEYDGPTPGFLDGMVAAHKVLGLEMPKLQLLVSEIATPEGYEYEKNDVSGDSGSEHAPDSAKAKPEVYEKAAHGERPSWYPEHLQVCPICDCKYHKDEGHDKCGCGICSGSSHETEDHDEYTASKAEENLLRRSLKEGLRSIQRACLTQAVHEEQVYERLKPFQAKGSVPTYLSPVELEIERDYTLPALPKEKPPKAYGETLVQSESTRIRQYLKIPGALISFVEGVTLDKVAKIASPADYHFVRTPKNTFDTWHMKIPFLKTHQDMSRSATARPPNMCTYLSRA